MATGTRMIFSIVTTLLVALAMLALGVNVVQTRGFRAPAPMGNDAMVVILWLGAALIAGVLLLLATGTCAATGGLAWASPRPAAALGLAMFVTLGIALGAAAVVWIWGDSRTPLFWPAALVGGLIAPAALAIVLTLCAWTPARSATQPQTLRAAGVTLCLGALVGYALSGSILVGFVRQSSENARRHREEIRSRDREAARKNALPLIDLLREEYPAMGDTAPLWILVARLPDAHDDATRQFIITRSLKAPDFDAELRGTATHANPRYRHGCLDLIRFAPDAAVKPEWRAIVESSIAVTARQMMERPTWLTDVDELANPDPVEHVRTLVGAARRVSPNGESSSSIESLRAAIDALPATDARAATLRLFER